MLILVRTPSGTQSDEDVATGCSTRCCNIAQHKVEMYAAASCRPHVSALALLLCTLHLHIGAAFVPTPAESRCPWALRMQASRSSSNKEPGNYTHSTMQNTGKGALWDRYQPDTRLIRGGYHGDEWSTDPLGRSFVNPPVFRASTITFPNVEAIREATRLAVAKKGAGITYGLFGTPTAFALEEAFAMIEGADNALSVSSGAAAINAAFFAFVDSGDHVLVSDGVYSHTRQLCGTFLKGKCNVATTYFDPTCSPDELEALMKPNTKLVFLESPSSNGFELHDFPALAARAKEHGLIVVADNTWGPTLFHPMALGADVSINAATKYISGHSDVMLGLIACTRDTYPIIRKSVQMLACPASPDDCYMALRGLRTLGVRLRQHGLGGLQVAEWLEKQPQVARVLHPRCHRIRSTCSGSETSVARAVSSRFS